MDIEALVSDCIAIEEHIEDKGIPVIRGTLLIDSEQAFKIIAERLKPFNLTPLLIKKNKKVEFRIREVPKQKPSKSWINLVLFIATIFTTIVAGSFLAGANPFNIPKDLLLGIPFSIALLLIIGSHELGHYFACKRRGIRATLPYFLPAPPPFPIGTFGAIIKIKAPIQDKKGLIEVGAAGPIIGFILAIPITIIGLQLSSIQPTIAEAMTNRILLGNSLMFWALSELFTNVPVGYDLSLHPVAFAGWVGMLITALNLIPIGQLDGGHISYALLGKKAKFIAWPFIGLMVFLGTYWMGWIIWAIFILVLIGIKHPPPLDDVTPLDTPHKIMGYVSLFIFTIAFTPVPFKIPA